MPAGKRRRLGAGAEQFFEPAFARRLFDAAVAGVGRLDRLALRQGGADLEVVAVTAAGQPAARGLLAWLGLRKPKDPLEQKTTLLMADLEAVARGRPAADPELARARGRDRPTEPSAGVGRKDVAA